MIKCVCMNVKNLFLYVNYFVELFYYKDNFNMNCLIFLMNVYILIRVILFIEIFSKNIMIFKFFKNIF